MLEIDALICSRLAPDLEGVALGTINLEPVRADEVQVTVHAAALNFPDLLMTQGGYQHKPEVPYVPGMEGAGVVTAVGSRVKQFQTGDAVHFAAKTGACGRRVNVAAERVWPLPEGFTFAQGAAFHVGALTAYVALVCRGDLQAGETLLVHGASGGMGLAAVQLGAHLGATVIATGTDKTRLDAARQCGAHHCLVIGEDLRSQVKALTNQQGVDLVFDPVGGDVFDQSLRMIAKQGRMLIVGFAGGRIAQLPTNIALIKELAIIGVRAGEYGKRQPALGLQNEQAIQQLAEQGVITPFVGATFEFVQAKDALRALSQRAYPGKIVITMN